MKSKGFFNEKLTLKQSKATNETTQILVTTSSEQMCNYYLLKITSPNLRCSS